MKPMGLLLTQYWKVVCRRPDGSIAWTAHAKNLIPTQMLNSVLNGVGYSLTFYTGLVDNAGFTAFAAGDTAASHGGWVENTDYDEANRPTLVRSTSTAAAWDNMGNEAVFTMNDTVSIKGLFMQSNATKLSTAGVLGGEVAFTEGTQAVSPGSELTVTVSGTAASA